MASSSSTPSGSMIPGRSALKKRPVDPKSGHYEHQRARDAYRKQLNIFKAKFEANLREYPRLDFDAKQEIRIKAKRQREICLKDYREGLQGLARSSFRRTYKDVFLGDRETQMEVYDSNVLEYELRLTSEMDTLIDNIRLLNVDKSNLSKLDWFSNLARAKFSYEYQLENEIDPDCIKTTNQYENEEIEPKSVSEYDPLEFQNPEVASIGSSAYVYRPFSRRTNLYRDEIDEPSNYRYDWQRLYDPKPSTTRSSRTISDYDDASITDKFDYEPFQPFCDEPIGRRRNRYPGASDDPEWASQSSVYSYHRPIQPSPRYTPNRFDTNLDSICPSYGYGQDDEDQQTVTSRGELMAGIDYEYKPIIPSYLRNGDPNKMKSRGGRFKYDEINDDNDFGLSSMDDDRFTNKEPSFQNQRNVHFEDQDPENVHSELPENN